ncbi:hypothetical protein NMY22_g7767 [Coprinellus aureogranulatus]|nr:hypothetical protein NMY22_g7767 [Coprinellus aureogranulatus]
MRPAPQSDLSHSSEVTHTGSRLSRLRGWILQTGRSHDRHAWRKEVLIQAQDLVTVDLPSYGRFSGSSQYALPSSTLLSSVGLGPVVVIVESSSLNNLSSDPSFRLRFSFHLLLQSSIHLMEFNLNHFVGHLFGNDPDPDEEDHPVDWSHWMGNDSTAVELRQLSQSTTFEDGDLATVVSSFGAHPSLPRLSEGEVPYTRDLDAILLSLLTLRTILKTIPSIPSYASIIQTTRRTVLEHWRDVAGWCSFLIRCLTPCLQDTNAEILAFIIASLTREAIWFEGSLISVPYTVNLALELWTSEDVGRKVIFLENDPDQNNSSDFICCPLVHVTALCLTNKEARSYFLQRVRRDGIASVVFSCLKDRMKRLSHGQIGVGRDHPIRRISILSQLANVGLKLMVDKELNFEHSISESKFFYWITFMVKAVNRQVLARLRLDSDSSDCYPIPGYSSMIMNRVIDGVIHMSFQHRLKNLQYIVSAGVLQVSLSVFTPCIIWKEENDRNDLCMAALNMATVVFVHSPYRAVGLEISRELGKNIFAETGAALRAYSAMGKAFVKSSLELHYGRMVPETRLSKRSQICSNIGCEIAGSVRLCTGSQLQTTVLKCSGCRRVVYCSKACQKSDWDKLHRKECGSLQEGERRLGEASRTNSGCIPLRHGMELATYLEAIVARDYRSHEISSPYPTGIFNAILIEMPLITDMVPEERFLISYAQSPDHLHGRSLDRICAYMQDSIGNPHQIKLAHIVGTYGKDFLAVLARFKHTVSPSGNEYRLMSTIISPLFYSLMETDKITTS